VQRLAPVVRRHALPIATLERLVEANRRDQALGRIESWGALVDSCGYSANPVGELVLGLFGVADERSIQLSDAICTGLQVVEHCQDVREDFERGRIYLPAEDMARLGCGAPDLAASKASAVLVETVRLQVGRARALFRSADPLLARLRGAAVPLVAGYAAGGLATCDALERQGFDVLAHAVRPARRDVLRHATRLVGRTWLVGARRGRTGRDR